MFLYIMHRTQIYLEEEQCRRLAERARSTGRTRSTLIREAIDAYLGATDEGESELEEFRRAVDDVAGIAPYLKPGAEYVEALHAADSRREAELERRRRR